MLLRLILIKYNKLQLYLSISYRKKKALKKRAFRKRYQNEFIFDYVSV